MAPSSGVTAVLHDVELPELPLFAPSLPFPKEPESGCVHLKGAAAPGQLLESMLAQEGLLPGFCQPTALVDPDTAGVQQQYRRPTVADYYNAYQARAVTPLDVCERILAFIAQADKANCQWFISIKPPAVLAAARESSSRWAAGKPLSILDGIPFAVKDVVDAEGHQTTAGTAFLAARRPFQVQAPFISNLLALGAILLGKTTLHEIGLGEGAAALPTRRRLRPHGAEQAAAAGITGLNTVTGTAKNPYSLRHHTGGSSSGSAAVVAAGLCPFAMGSDGGGSIRIPSSFCGLVGLKPTAGRIPSVGAVQGDLSVAVLGPLAGCVQDAMLGLAVAAHWGGPEAAAGQLLPGLAVPQSTPAAPLGRFGIYGPWFQGLVVTPPTHPMQAHGAARQDVCIPELELLRVAHNVTIVSEMRHCFQGEVDDPQQRRRMNLETRVGLNSAGFWTPADYIQAQRIRARCTIHFQKALENVDVLITPCTPCTAPVIPPGAATGGASDLGQVSIIMRFMPAANFLGLPAISVPVGVDSKGLPIGLQLIAKPWCEATLLRWAATLEAALQAQSGSRPVAGLPAVWLDPLTGASCKPIS